MSMQATERIFLLRSLSPTPSHSLSRKLKTYPFELIGVVLAPAVMAMTVAFWALNTVFVVQAQEASLRFTIQLRQNLESFLGDL